MQLAPRARLEQYARDEYRRHFHAVAPPKVRNAVAVVALGEHRPLRWRGHHYTVPPLPWRPGMALLACRQVMGNPTASAAARERAVQTARRIARTVIRNRFGRRPWLNPFRAFLPEQVAQLLDWLLDVPDDCPPPPAGPEARKPVDLMDGLQEYLRGGYPVTPDGYPASWAHYQYGLRHAARVSARETLRLANANRVATADKKDWRTFTDELRGIGGW